MFAAVPSLKAGLGGDHHKVLHGRGSFAKPPFQHGLRGPLQDPGADLAPEFRSVPL